MALDVPPPQTPPAIVEAGDARGFMTGSEVAAALRALAAHPVFNSIPAAAFFTRQQLAKAFTACGFPTTPATLATKAVRGGGPPFRIFGKNAVYQWGDAVAWIHESMGASACTTAERRARMASPPAPQKPSPAKLAAMVEGSRRYNASRVAARHVAAQKKAKPKRSAEAAATPPST